MGGLKMHIWKTTAIAAALPLLALPGAGAPDTHHESETAPALSGPITMAEAVQIAIERSPATESTRAAIRSADAQVRAVRASHRLLITAASYLTHASTPITFTAPSPSPPVGSNGGTPFSYGYAMPNAPHYGQNIMFM